MSRSISLSPTTQRAYQPQDSGWLYELKLANASDLDALLDETAYAQLTT